MGNFLSQNETSTKTFAEKSIHKLKFHRFRGEWGYQPFLLEEVEEVEEYGCGQEVKVWGIFPEVEVKVFDPFLHPSEHVWHPQT